ncbi:hypothetical protein F4779DRAFT_1116 [Xylariaceae sp. FL0662B]|nr:hypothetical protein F4779DRAFT_1116 [Xylariaceae sp. FL0662B]
MSHTQDKAHSQSLLNAIAAGEKAQQQGQTTSPNLATSTKRSSSSSDPDSASTLSSRTFSSTRALLKGFRNKVSPSSPSSSSPSSKPGSEADQRAQLQEQALRNQMRMGS